MGDVIATTGPAMAYYVDRVKRRLATGFYHTEPVACFCGSTEGQPVRTVDRYGLPHRMCFCARCGILYASPRMTLDSLKTFYEQDYRAIYDDGNTGEDLANERQDQLDNGAVIKVLCEKHGLVPSVVFELGCNEGGALDAFLRGGSECLGVDYDATQVATGQLAGRPVIRGGIEALEQYGKKADLIIAHHVLEHVTDIEETVLRLRALLTPKGMLFVALPTLFHVEQDQLYQNAHTYQFTARTLQYLMECCGFEDAYLSEGINSLWRPVDRTREKTDVDAHEVYRIANFLNGGKQIIPMIRTVNKFDKSDRIRHITSALQAKRRNLHEIIGSLAEREAVILGGGPSIDAEVQTVADLQNAGHAVFAIERMLPWCLANGIMPDYVVAMDAHEDVVGAFTRLPTEPAYLVALQCHPSVLDALRERTVYTFATPQKGIDQEQLFMQHGDACMSQVNAGGSVTICAMSLAMTLGAKRLHIFGFDCQFTEKWYADHIAGVGAIDNVTEIHVDGYGERTFKTTLPYLAFAQQFLELVELGRRLDTIQWAKIYGDSLVRYIAKPNPVLES